MARKRWANISAKERTAIARAAAQARWAAATKHDFEMARLRARAAREARTKQLVAKALGVSVSDLDGVEVELIDASTFRRKKTEEQNKYWKSLRKRKPLDTAYIHALHRRARSVKIVHPTGFSLIADRKNVPK